MLGHVSVGSKFYYVKHYSECDNRQPIYFILCTCCDKVRVLKLIFKLKQFQI